MNGNNIFEGTHKEHLSLYDVFFGSEDVYQVCYPKSHQVYFLIIICLSIFIITLLAFIIYFLKKNAKRIAEKNLIIETQNKELLDSITYALRIQTAILPPRRIVKKHLEQSFILYRPKNIVAGDFYWTETSGSYLFFAACDCTGHGVPGAMISMLCHSALTKSVKEFSLTQPSEILERTNEIIIEHFSNSDEMIHDGMDVSLCAYNTETKTLEWAGANNPIWIYRNHAASIEELKPTKKAIGRSDEIAVFHNHHISLGKGDRLYLFSDGFADQFGGVEKKKLTKKRFRELILSMQSYALAEQESKLDAFLLEYRNGLEQTDDILVMGVEL